MEIQSKPPVVEEAVVHAASDVHALLLASHGSVQSHIRVTADQVDLVVQGVGEHGAETRMRQCNPRRSKSTRCSLTTQMGSFRSLSDLLLHNVL